MNNSKIASMNSDDSEESHDRNSILQTQQGELSQVVEAINRVEQSSDWQKLKRLTLDGVLANLEHQLLKQMMQKEINLPEVYRLQGQITWAKKYVDLKKLGEFFKLQIESIKNQLKQ